MKNYKDFITEKKDKIKIEVEDVVSPEEQKNKKPESQGSDDVVVDMVDDELKDKKSKK